VGGWAGAIVTVRMSVNAGCAAAGFGKVDAHSGQTYITRKKGGATANQTKGKQITKIRGYLVVNNSRRGFVVSILDLTRVNNVPNTGDCE
jgi:hypothetical protein